MISRDVDQHETPVLMGVVTQPPPASLHVDHQAPGTIPLAHRLVEVYAAQSEIVRVRGAHAVQKSREAVRLHSAQCLLKKLTVGMVHLQIEEGSIDLCLRICLFEIQPIEDVGRVDKAKALSADIAEIGLGKVVFQPGSHFTCRVAFVKVERPHSPQVSSDLWNAELCLTESDAVHFLQVSQQCVGTTVHSFPVDPYKWLMTEIIAFYPTIHQHRVVVVADHRVQSFLHLKTGNMIFALT